MSFLCRLHTILKKKGLRSESQLLFYASLSGLLAFSLSVISFDINADLAGEFLSATLELLIKRRKTINICDPLQVSNLKPEFPGASDMELSGRKRNWTSFCSEIFFLSKMAHGEKKSSCYASVHPRDKEG